VLAGWYRAADPSPDRCRGATDHDRGQKKGHTVKNLLIIDETCPMCFLSDPCEGKAHDKSLADLAGYTLPDGSCLDQEMGFQGCTLDGMTMVQPKKKPRGGELTPREKATNRSSSSIRIRIEHAIGGVKRYRMVKDQIRLLKDGIRDTLLDTCCGLHNFRLRYRPWNYAH
jgi:DDE superfamily endonuclease